MTEPLGRRHARTLESIFALPTPATIRWAEFAALVKAIGGNLTERESSRVAVTLQGRTMVIHKPHPRPEIKRSTVRDIRDFLFAAGVSP